MREVPPLLCTWQGIVLQVTRVSDQYGRTWVEHAYPGRDGVELEDMGRQARRMTLEVVFNGSSWFVDLWTLKDAVESAPTVAGNFVHPYLGTFFGVLRDLNVEHVDQKEDYARATCTFVEGALAPFAFAVSTTLASAAAAAEAASAAATAFTSMTSEILPPQ